jgi:hypothetical protein
MTSAENSPGMHQLAAVNLKGYSSCNSYLLSLLWLSNHVSPAASEKTFFVSVSWPYSCSDM